VAGIEQGFLAWLAPMDVMKKVASQLGVEIDHILPFGHRNNYLTIFDDFFVKRKQKPLACGLHRNGCRSIVFVTEPLRPSGQRFPAG
jgi:hypothetical protein